MLCFVSYQSPSLICQSKNFQRPTNRRALAGAVLAKFNLRGPHALDPPRSAVASKPSLQQPTQPSLEGNNNIHTWPTLPSPPVLPVQATQATCPAVARLGLISGNSVTETEILGENRLQCRASTRIDSASVLSTLPPRQAYSAAAPAIYSSSRALRRVRGLGERHHLHSLVHLSSEPKAAFKAEVEPLFPPFSLRLRAQKVEELWRLLSVMPPYFCRPEITRVRRQGLIAVCPVRGGSGSRVHCPRVLLAAAAKSCRCFSSALTLCLQQHQAAAGRRRDFAKGTCFAAPKDCGSDSTHAAMFKRETQRR